MRGNPQYVVLEFGVHFATLKYMIELYFFSPKNELQYLYENMLKLILTTCILIINFSISGQVDTSNYYSKFYTLKDGLPSNETFSIEEDGEGHIWVGTDAGLAMYNGRYFKTYPLVFNELMIVDIQYNSTSGLWFLGYSGNVYRFNKKLDIVELMQKNASVDRGKQWYVEFELYDHYLILNKPPNNTYICSIDTGGLSIIQEYRATKSNVDYLQWNDEMFFLSHSINSWKKIKFNYRNADSLPVSLNFDIDYKTTNVFKHFRNKNDHFLLIRDRMLKMDAEGNILLNKPNKDALHVFKPESKNSGRGFWISQRNNGLTKLDMDSFAPKERLLKGFSVSDLLVRNKGDMWASTLNNGIVQIAPKNLQTIFELTFENDEVNFLFPFYDKLFIGTEEGYGFQLEQNGRQFIKKKIGQLDNSIKRINAIDNRVYYETKFPFTFFSFSPNEPNGFTPYVVQSNELLDDFLIDKTNRPGLDTKKRVLRIFDLEEKGVYYSGFFKTYYYNNSGVDESKTDTLAIAGVRAVVPYEDRVLLGAKNGKLYLLEKGEVQQEIHANVNLTSLISISKSPSDYFIATKSELFSFKKMQNDSINCQSWNDILGLKNAEINLMCSWGEQIVLFINNKLLIFNPTDVKFTRYNEGIKTVRVLAGKQMWLNPSLPIVVDSDAGSLTLEVDGNIEVLSQIKKLDYRVLPIDSTWIPVSKKIVFPLNWKKGKYQIQLRVPCGNCKNGFDLKVVDIHIKEPTIMGDLLIWISGILLILGIVFLIVKTRKGRALKEKKENSVSNENIEFDTDKLIPEQALPEKISIPTRNGARIITVKNMVRLQSDSNYTKIYLENGKLIMVSKTLKVFQNLLSESNFLRVHRSHIINVEYIHEFTSQDGGYIILKNKEEIPIGTSFRGHVEMILNERIRKI